jgi:hypothetical protein
MNDCGAFVGTWSRSSCLEYARHPKKDDVLPDPRALGGLLSAGPIATELLNINNPSQATCIVNVISDIVRVNLSPLLTMRSGSQASRTSLLLKSVPNDLHRINNQVGNRCSASPAQVLLIICFF